MEITVSGHQTGTGDAFRDRVGERLQGLATKYFARAVSANVVLGTGPHDAGFTCEIVMHVRAGLVLKATNGAMDANPAFDGAAERIDKQLRRYSRRLKDHAGAPKPDAGADSDPTFDNARYVLFGPAADEEPPENPLVVAETRVDIPALAVADAVMMLDLRHTNALLFKNGKTGALNMVYRREDGNVGWVEPRDA